MIGKGRFFQPTLLADCTHEMDVIMKESFGPILPVVRVSSDEEGIQVRVITCLSNLFDSCTRARNYDFHGVFAKKSWIIQSVILRSEKGGIRPPPYSSK